jgi:hypothetical protein
MCADNKKFKPSTRNRITACQQETIDAIKDEAEKASPATPTPTDQFAKLK